MEFYILTITLSAEHKITKIYQKSQFPKFSTPHPLIFAHQIHILCILFNYKLIRKGLKNN